MILPKQFNIYMQKIFLKIIKQHQNLFYLIILLCIIFICYFRVIFFPFVHDDFIFAERFEFLPLGDVLLGIIDPRGKEFYRPLSNFYMLLLYKLFGLNSIPGHLISLLIHTINSFLVSKLCMTLTKNNLLGYITGIVFAVSLPIHIDILSWSLAGIQDLGNELFFFLTILFYIHRKNLLSYMSFFLSLLFKESSLILPLILFVYTAFSENCKSFHGLLRLFKKLTVYFLVLIVFLIIKSFGISPLYVAIDHPYRMDIIGTHIIKNYLSYLGWMMQVIIPYTGEIKVIWYILLILALVCGQLIYSWFLGKRNASISLKKIGFLYIWVILALIPAVFLPNHTYRYYAVYSLPPFLVAHLTFGYWLLNVCNKVASSLTHKNMFLEFSIFLVLFSIINSNLVFKQGLYQKVYLDGTNLLIPRSNLVNIIRRDLTINLPNLPANSVIVFKNVDLGAISGASALRLWYQDKTIQVFLWKDLEKDERGYFIWKNFHKEYISRSNLFIFKMTGTKLVPIELIP